MKIKDWNKSPFGGYYILYASSKISVIWVNGGEG